MIRNITIIMSYKLNSAAGNRISSFINVMKKKYNINFILLYDKSYSSPINNQDIQVHFIKPRKIRKTNFLKRAFQEIFLSYNIYKKSKNIKSDILLITSPSMFLIPIFAFDKRKKILDIRDLVWEYIENRYIRKILNIIIKFSIKKYSYIVVTNKFEKKYLDKMGIHNTIVVPNGISLDRFEILKKIDLDLPKKTVISYIGNVGIAQNIVFLCKIAKELPEIEVNIVGDGAKFNEIKKFIIENNINNVNLYGALEWEEVLNIYKKTSILFASLNRQFYTAVPSKLYEYLSTGLPILYIGEGAAVDMLSEFENTYLFKENEINNVIKFLRTFKVYNKSISNIEKISNKFIREKNSKKLIDIIEGQI